MIDFTEIILPRGGMRASLRSDELPKGMYYQITLWTDGKVTAKSRGYGNGSVRYYGHASYEQALGHGFNWAKRRIAEARRIQRANSAAIDQAVESIRARLMA